MEVVEGTTYSLNGFSKQQLSDSRRQYSWERGQIDYLGIDSFDNILSQLDAKLTWLRSTLSRDVSLLRMPTLPALHAD